MVNGMHAQIVTNKLGIIKCLPVLDRGAMIKVKWMMSTAMAMIVSSAMDLLTRVQVWFQMTVSFVTRRGMNSMMEMVLALNKRIMLNLILILGVAGPGLAQDILSASITYVSRDRAFIDIGRNSGVQIGDTLQVYRNGGLIGIALISQTSGASSAIEAYDPVDISWEIGDQVDVEVRSQELTQITNPSIIDSSLDVNQQRQVFLDSTAFKPRSQSNSSIDSDRLSPSFSGYLSTRVSDRGGDTSGVGETTASIYGQFKILDIGVRHLDATTYIRSNKSTSDTLVQNRLYSLMISYANPASPFSYQAGRMYHPQFSMLGTIDGLGMSWSSEKRTIAFAAGVRPNISNLPNQIQRNKFGIIDEEVLNWGKIQVGYIGETESGAFSRNYILFGSTARLGPSLRLRGYSEFDLDLQDQSEHQSTASLTRFRTSINWRPWRSVISSARYSYRENVIDLLDTARSEYEQAARHMLNTNVSFMLSSGLTISGQASFRGDGSGRKIKMFGISFSHQQFTARALSLHVGGMAMLSYLSEGGRVYSSLGFDLTPWLDVDLYDEVFFYKILGDSSYRIRHLPEISFSAKVPGLQRLRLRTRFENEGGELLYRFSLSASKQL